MNVPARKIKARIHDPQVVLKTLEDLFAIPEEEQRHELIEGTIYPTKEATSGEHGGAQYAIAAWTSPFARRQGRRSPGGWWFGTEVDIFFDVKSTFKPDVAGWRRERVPERPTGIPIRIRPDWVCEILSTNRGHDLIRKKRVYHRHEVTHYWIVDPLEQTLSVNRWSPDGYTEVLTGVRNEIVHPEPFEVLPLQVSILFGEDPVEDEVDDADAVAKEEPSGSD
jgi:Uma2 family endonuclease